MTTYQITGSWSGPANPAGDWVRLQHVEYVRSRGKDEPSFVQSVRELGSIIFTDGTALHLEVADVTGIHRNHRPPEKRGYDRLIRECVRHGVSRVADLPRREP